MYLFLSSVVMATVAALSVIIEVLPKFLSPYVGDIITKVTVDMVTSALVDPVIHC